MLTPKLRVFINSPGGHYVVTVILRQWAGRHMERNTQSDPHGDPLRTFHVLEQGAVHGEKPVRCPQFHYFGEAHQKIHRYHALLRTENEKNYQIGVSRFDVRRA